MAPPAANSKVFARLFQKAAGSKGGALGRHPQMAEYPMLQAHLGGWGDFARENPPRTSLFCTLFAVEGLPVGEVARRAGEGTTAF